MQSLRNRLINLGASGAILGAAAFLGPIESGSRGPQLFPYADIGGVATWCYGETTGQPKARYTATECDALLLKSVQKHWAGISMYVPEDAPKSVKEAMISVAYNVGPSGWAWELRKDQKVPSRFRVALARKDWQGACAAITAPWQGTYGTAKGYKATVKGKPSRGLENRRAREAVLCRADL